MPQEPVQITVIGAGAAGLMTAITAARAGVRVRLLDGNRKIGAKILVSGGTRCNVTNEYVAPARFNGGPSSFTGRILRAFSLQDTLRFFEKIGVPLKLEETGKFFPVSDSAKTVLAALLQELEAAGATLTKEASVTAIEKTESGFVITTPAESFTSRCVVLCTGGLALPLSGSDGRGYQLAAHLGHTLVRTTPALTPLLAPNSPHVHLSGITLPAALTLTESPENSRVLARFEGSFLFTHFGYSGPVALNISRHIIRERWKFPQAQVQLRLLTDVPFGEEGPWWQDWQKSQARKSIGNALAGKMPARVVETTCEIAGVNSQDSVGRMSGPQTKALRRALLEQPLPVEKVADYVKAETTAGGIPLEEIEPNTMMSKLTPGLFFAGEICDVDGWLGGYNFQWAWSSGTVAGRAAAKYVKQPLNS